MATDNPKETDVQANGHSGERLESQSSEEIDVKVYTKSDSEESRESYNQSDPVSDEWRVRRQRLLRQFSSRNLEPVPLDDVPKVWRHTKHALLRQFSSLAANPLGGATILPDDDEEEDEDREDDGVPSESTENKGLKARLARWRANAEPAACWFLLLAVVMPINIVFGIELLSFPLFYVEYDQYFEDATSFNIGLIVSLRLVMLSVFGMVSSVLLTRFGLRPVAISGGLVMTLSLVAASFAKNIITLYFTHGVALGVGSSMVLMVGMVCIQHKFHRNRALAGGVAVLGVSLGSAIGTPLTELLIETYGWRWTLRMHGAVLANIVPLGVMLTFDDLIWPPRKPRVSSANNNTSIRRAKSKTSECSRKKQSKCRAFGSLLKDIFDFSLLKYVPFLFISLAGVTYRYGVQTFIFHLANRAVWLGMRRTDGAAFLFACAVNVILCRLAVMFLANSPNVSRTLLYTIGCFWSAACAFLLVPFKSYWGQMGVSVLYGVAIAMTSTVSTVMLVDLLGVHKIARALAVFNLLVGLSSIVSTPLSGYLYDVTESYDPPFLLTGSLAVAAGIFSLLSFLLDRRYKAKAAASNHT